MFVTSRVSTSPWVVICGAKLLFLLHPTRLPEPDGLDCANVHDGELVLREMSAGQSLP